MPNATERKESIQKEMAKTGLSYEFVIPEDSDDIESKSPGWTSGANSLRLTTIKLIEEAIEDKKDFVWIWEDDSIIDKRKFDSFIKEFKDFTDFDFIHLNYSAGTVFSGWSKGLLRKTIDGVECCQSYIISSCVFKEYLKALQIERPIDLSTKFLHKKRQRSYVVDLIPVSHKAGKYSYIRDKIVNY
jgi:hypothetical protein